MRSIARNVEPQHDEPQNFEIGRSALDVGHSLFIGPLGFEPRLTDPKSAVLPLDEGPVACEVLDNNGGRALMLAPFAMRW